MSRVYQCYNCPQLGETDPDNKFWHMRACHRLTYDPQVAFCFILKSTIVERAFAYAENMNATISLQ